MKKHGCLIGIIIVILVFTLPIAFKAIKNYKVEKELDAREAKLEIQEKKFKTYIDRQKKEENAESDELEEDIFEDESSNVTAPPSDRGSNSNSRRENNSPNDNIEEDKYKYEYRPDFLPYIDWPYQDEIEEAVINRYGENYNPEEVDPDVILDDLYSNYDYDSEGEYDEEY